MNDFAPTKIFTHYEFDNHEDHRIVFRSVMSVARPIPKHSVRDIYSMEIPSSTNFTYNPGFAPDTFLQMSEKDLERKISALECYSSEVKPYPFPRSREAITAYAKFRGMQIGVEYGEAFKVIRSQMRD